MKTITDCGPRMLYTNSTPMCLPNGSLKEINEYSDIHCSQTTILPTTEQKNPLF